MVARQRLSESVGVRTERRLQRVERAAPIGYSSVTRGGLRVQSPDGIIVKTVPGGLPGLRVTGLQLVDGTLRVTGTLEGVGTWMWTGPWTLAGNGSITGTVDISGDLNLLSNLVVSGGGTITAGAVTITPGGGGSVKVGTLQIDGENGGTIRSPGTVYIQGLGANSARVVGRLAASDVLSLGDVVTGGLVIQATAGAPVGAVPLMIDPSTNRVYRG